MNPIEQAIKEAMENGYGSDEWREWLKLPLNEMRGYQWETLFSAERMAYHFLCPSFWQALGKARGWKMPEQMWMKELTPGGITEAPNRPWVQMMISFIDHLAEGNDAESFFKEL
jgi:hypothetical protein